MYLYSLTLNHATAIQSSVYGNFSSPKNHELVVAKGKLLELLRPDDTTGRLSLISRQEVFGLVRAIKPFRLLGMQKDFLVVGSDSGRIAILEYDNEKNRFVKVHQETFGKTGVRRIVPGEYLAVDPKGRAIMIGAIEKQKFVYILNRDSANKLTISSPLEAHKAHTVTFAMVGVDVGIENPQFACLECDYGEPDNQYSAVVTGTGQKALTFYEMDLGLNHVVRKYSTPVDNSAHMLIQVPGDPDGPGGILVVCENFLVYKRMDHEDRTCTFPRRNDQLADRGLFFTCHSTLSQKDLFFFLVQSEFGDLYKVSLNYMGQEVHGIHIQYFDTIAPCVEINILRTGFLFAAAEFSNHLIYEFKNIGDEEIAPIQQYSTDPSDKLVTFNPREPQNLNPKDELQNLASINDMKIEDLTGEGNPQIYLACGRGAQSTLRVLRHGLSVIEMAVSSMPGKPLFVATLQGKLEDSFDKYMIVSLPDRTLVLSIGEEKVTEVLNSGFFTNERTLHAGILEDSSYVQVTSSSIIHIRGDENNRKRNKWESNKGKITKVCSNQKQVVISIEGGQVVYFELDDMSNSLREVLTKLYESDIACIDIGEVPEGRQRCRFLAVGFMDRTVKILSLDPESCLTRISMQALPAMPDSVALLNFQRDDAQQQQLFLHVGLDNGVLLRTVVDNVTGVLSDSRTRFLGTSGIKLSKVKQHGQDALVALCNKPWLIYSHMNRVNITPISYEMLEEASSFSSEQCPEGILAISGNTLRIISVVRLGEQFTHTVMPLRYTPSKIQIHPDTNYLVILEKDHNCHSHSERMKIKEQIYEKTKDEDYLKIDDSKISYPRAGENKFASCIRIVDPFTFQTIELIEFENNEVVFSHFITQTLGNPGETYLILGIGLDVKLSPRTCSLGFIRTYKFVDGGKRLELYHSTPCEDIPSAFNEYKGRLVAGVGNILRVYELGHKKLLRKCENKNFTSPIIKIQVEEGRIYAGDMQESVHVLKYKPEEVQLYIFCDDVLNRWLTNFCLLDQDTIAGVDKFENVFVNRLPLGCEDDAEDDPTATKFKWENGYLNGAAFKMEEVCQFFIGEVSTCIQKASLSHGSSEAILFGTTMGGIGALLPFETREDIDFFVHLEMYLRIESQPLCGRDHVTFRSTYVPAKDVIDGDLCEMFSSLEFNKQRVLAEEMDRTPPEVLKKLENLRNKIL